MKYLFSLFPLFLFGQPYFDWEKSYWEQIKLENNDSVKAILFTKLTEGLVYSQPSRALEMADSAIYFSKNLESKGPYIYALNRKGGAYYSKGDLSKAIEHFTMSMSLAKALSDSALMARNAQSLGAVYSSASDYHRAFLYYNEALKYYLKTKNLESATFIYNNIGKGFAEQGILDSAYVYLEKGVIISKEVANPSYGILLFNLADVFFRLGNIEECMRMLENCEKVANAGNDIRVLARTKQLKSEVEIQRGEKKNALILAKEAFNESKLMGIMEISQITAQTLSKAFEINGETDSALYFIKISRVYADSMKLVQARNRLSIYEHERMNSELQIVNEKNLLAIYKSKNQRILMTFLILALLILAFLIFRILKTNQKYKRANLTLEKANNLILAQKEELAESSRLKTKLLGILAHDLKTPLASIKTSLELVKQEWISQQEFQQLVPAISQQTDRILVLIKSIMDWVKKSTISGHIVLDLHEIPVRPFLEKLINLYQEILIQKRIELKIEVVKVDSINSDEEILQTILRNFLSNAIKFTPEGGHITISVQESKNYIDISISDSGEGMDEKTLSCLFTADTIVNMGTSGEKGSGFGLIIAKDLADICNSIITVESTVGKGSKFTISVPI